MPDDYTDRRRELRENVLDLATSINALSTRLQFLRQKLERKENWIRTYNVTDPNDRSTQSEEARQNEPDPGESYAYIVGTIPNVEEELRTFTQEQNEELQSYTDAVNERRDRRRAEAGLPPMDPEQRQRCYISGNNIICTSRAQAVSVEQATEEPTNDERGRNDIVTPDPAALGAGTLDPDEQPDGRVVDVNNDINLLPVRYDVEYFIKPYDGDNENISFELLFDNLISKINSYHEESQSYDGIVDINFEEEAQKAQTLKEEILSSLFANWNDEYPNNQKNRLSDFSPGSFMRITASLSSVITHIVYQESTSFLSTPVSGLLTIEESIPENARIREWIFKLIEIYEDDSSSFIEFCNRFCIDFPVSITSGEDIESRIMSSDNLREAITANGVEVREEDIDRFENYLNTVSVRTEEFRNKVNSLLNDYTLNRIRTNNAIANVESNVDGFFENISKLIVRLEQITSSGPDGLHQYDGSFGEIVNRVEIGEITEEIMKCLAKQANVSFDDVRTAYYYGLGDVPRPDKPFYEIARRSLPDLDAFRIPDFDYDMINSRARMGTFMQTLGRTYKDILVYALIETFKKMLMELIKMACLDNQEFPVADPLPEEFTNEDYVMSLENMLEDLDSLIPFNEWCALFIGEAKNDTLLTVLKITEIRYQKVYEMLKDPTARGIRELFVNIGKFSDTSFCSSFYGSSICLDRDEILKNRLPGLLDDDINSANNNLIQFLNDIKSGKNFNLPAVSDVQKASNESSLNDETMQAAFEKTMSAIYDSLYSAFDTNAEAFKNIVITNESTLSTTEEGNSVEIKRSCLKGLRNEINNSDSNFFFNEYRYDDGSKYRGFSIKVGTSVDDLLSSLKAITTSRDSGADIDTLSAFSNIDLGSIIDNSYIEVDYIVKDEETGAYTLVVSNSDGVLFFYNGEDTTAKRQAIGRDSSTGRTIYGTVRPVNSYKTTNYEKAIKKAYSEASIKIEKREGDEPVILSEEEASVIFKNTADQSYPDIVSFVYSLISKKMSSSPFFKNIIDSNGEDENTTVLETLNLSRRCDSKSVLFYNAAPGASQQSQKAKKILETGSNKEKLIKSMKESLSRTTIRSYVYDYFLRSIFTSSMIREDEKSFISDSIVNVYKTEIKRDIINKFSTGDNYLRGLFITEDNEELDEMLEQEIISQLADIRKTSRESFEFNKDVPSFSELMVKDLLHKRDIPHLLGYNTNSLSTDGDYWEVMTLQEDPLEDAPPIYLEKYVRIHPFGAFDPEYSSLPRIYRDNSTPLSNIIRKTTSTGGSLVMSLYEFNSMLDELGMQDRFRRLSRESSPIETLDDISFTSSGERYTRSDYWGVSIETAKKICRLHHQGFDTDSIHDRVHESLSTVNSGPSYRRRKRNIRKVIRNLCLYSQYSEVNETEADFLLSYFFNKNEEVNGELPRFCFAKRLGALEEEFQNYRVQRLKDLAEFITPAQRDSFSDEELLSDPISAIVSRMAGGSPSNEALKASAPSAINSHIRVINTEIENYRSLVISECPPSTSDLEYLNKPLFKKIEFCYRLCVDLKESEKKIRLKNISIDDELPAGDLNGLIIDKKETLTDNPTPKFMTTVNDRKIAGAVNDPWMYSLEEKHGEALRAESWTDALARSAYTLAGQESNIASVKNNYEGKFQANSSYDDIDDGEFRNGPDPRRHSDGGKYNFRSPHSGFGKEFAQRVTYLTSKVGFFNTLSTIFSTVWMDRENPEDLTHWFHLLNRHPENELDTTDNEVERYNTIKEKIIPRLEQLRDNPSLINTTQEGGFIREFYYELRNSKERGFIRELRKPYLLRRKDDTVNKQRYAYGDRAHRILFNIFIYLGIVTDLVFETNSKVREIAESESDFLLLEEVSGPASLQAGLEESIESSLTPSDLEYEYVSDSSDATSSFGSSTSLFFVNDNPAFPRTLSERAYQYFIHRFVEGGASRKIQIDSDGNISFVEPSYVYSIPVAEERILLSDSVNTPNEFKSNYTTFDPAIESLLLDKLSENQDVINFMYSSFPLKDMQEMINLIMFYSLGIQKNTSSAFSSTRFLLKASYDNIESGGEEPSSEITKLGGEEGVALVSKQMSAPGADLSVYEGIFEATWDFLKKAAIEAPKKILMDMAENSDPNIMISKRIKDGIKLITPAPDGSGTATDTAEAVDNAAETFGGDADGLVDTTKKISSAISKVNDIPIAPISIGLSFWVPPTPLTQAYIALDLGDSLSEMEQRRRSKRRLRQESSEDVQQSLLEELEIVDKTSCD